MTAIELILALDELDVSVEVRGGRLRYGPKERMTTELLMALDELRVEVTRELNRRKTIRCPRGCNERFTVIDGYGFCPSCLTSVQHHIEGFEF